MTHRVHSGRGLEPAKVQNELRYPLTIFADSHSTVKYCYCVHYFSSYSPVYASLTLICFVFTLILESVSQTAALLNQRNEKLDPLAMRCSFRVCSCFICFDKFYDKRQALVPKEFLHIRCRFYMISYKTKYK
jgi:hypothetical protein